MGGGASGTLRGPRAQGESPPRTGRSRHTREAELLPVPLRGEAGPRCPPSAPEANGAESIPHRVELWVWQSWPSDVTFP